MKYFPFFPSPEQVKAAVGGQLGAVRLALKQQPPAGWFLMDDAVCIQESGYQWTEHDGDDDMMGWFPSYDNGLMPPYQPGDVLYFREPQWIGGIRCPGTQMRKADARLFFQVAYIKPQKLQDHTINQMCSEGYESYGAYRNDWDMRHRGDLRYAYNPWTWYVAGKIVPRPEG